jgi:hypothetical protein
LSEEVRGDLDQLPLPTVGMGFESVVRGGMRVLILLIVFIIFHSQVVQSKYGGKTQSHPN